MTYEFQNKEWALRAQNEMAQRVILEDQFEHPIKYIGGMDVSNTPFDPKQLIFGAAVVCDLTLSVVQKATSGMKQTMPYIRGLLGFREAPVLLHAFEKLSCLPEVILVDGHGISHPRGLGIASHVGVLLDLPTIGVAKKVLVGSPAKELGHEVGSMTPLLWKDREIAMLVRTKKRCAPLIISSGHKISLQTAVTVVMGCLKKHRFCEPIRYAHLAANEHRRAFLKNSFQSFIL